MVLQYGTELLLDSVIKIILYLVLGGILGKTKETDPELRETVILISHYKEDISEVDAVYELKNGVLSKK